MTVEYVECKHPDCGGKTKPPNLYWAKKGQRP